MEDRNFDDLAEKFARKIYADKKGEIRLNILWRDLKEFVPEVYQEGSNLSVLDAGGGIGLVSSELAKLSHRVVHSDPSENMIALAKTHAEKIGAAMGSIRYRHESVQAHPIELLQQYDLVLFHAVLEWLVEPKQTLEYLLKNMKSGAVLSLMFYNRHSVVLTNLFKGNFRKVRSGEMGGSKRSLTPINPIDPALVYETLEENGFTTQVISGVRVFNDYIPRPLRQERTLEDTLELEVLYSREEPYRSIARYIHVIAVAP